MPDTEEALALPVVAMAESCHRVFHSCRNVPPVSWAALGLSHQDGWEAVVLKAQTILGDGAEVRAKSLAERLFLAHQTQVSPETTKGYDALDLPLQLAWEAVARHLVNMLGAMEIDLGPAEAHWRNWLQAKLEPAKAE